MTYLSCVAMSDPTSLVGYFSRVLQDWGRIQREYGRRQSEESECLRQAGTKGWAINHDWDRIRTSGRCWSTDSLLLSRAFKISLRVVAGEDSVFIWCLASSSHALTRVLRALSPWPNSAVTLASGRGRLGGVGNDSTDKDKASRVNPCVSMSGRASFRSLALHRI